MVQYNRGKRLVRLTAGIFILAAATAAGVAAYLVYKGSFNSITYSNWLFYASMAFITFGGFSTYGSYMSVNNISYKYASTVMTSNYETRKRIDDLLISNSFSFSIRMIATGLLLLLASALADKLL